MEQELLIFVPSNAPRVAYTFSLFFDALLSVPHKITMDTELYKSYKGPKFNYSPQQIESAELFFCSSPLLFETGIHSQSITISEWKGLKVFYKVSKGALPFDIFAASFYLVSRYEEYLAIDFDKHKRFRASDSLAFKNQFLNLPLVNLWAEEFKKILLEKYPGLVIKDTSYKFIPTIDIDVAYSHLGKNWQVTMGAFLRALLKLNFSAISDKILTLLHIRKDPYDTYDYQEAIFKKYNIKPIYFLLAAKRASYDKNISTNSTHFEKLIKKLESFADVGIHPSYHSNNRPEIVNWEVKNVEKHLKDRITKSRKHFLKIDLPETYRCFAELGITDDYTMAYASCPGFRASICTPFFFYDLKEEKTLPVKVHSAQVMDGTLREYMNLTKEEATILIKKMVAETKKAKGEFISIWHNHSMSESGEWKGWRKVFETLIEEAI